MNRNTCSNIEYKYSGNVKNHLDNEGQLVAENSWDSLLSVSPLQVPAFEIMLFRLVQMVSVISVPFESQQ